MWLTYHNKVKQSSKYFKQQPVEYNIHQFQGETTKLVKKNSHVNNIIYLIRSNILAPFTANEAICVVARGRSSLIVIICANASAARVSS